MNAPRKTQQQVRPSREEIISALWTVAQWVLVWTAQCLGG